MEYKFDVSGRFKRGLRVSYRHAVSGFVLIVTWARVMTQKKDGFVSRSKQFSPTVVRALVGRQRFFPHGVKNLHV